MATGSTNFKNSINIAPQSADPSSPAEGDVFYSDGTSQTEGIYVYKNAAWVAVQLGALKLLSVS